MKVHNAVNGMEVQVKRDCHGYGGEFIKGGLVCTVSDIVGEDYELRLKNPDIDDGYAWVNASDVRRYIKPTKSPFVVEPDEVPDEPQEDIQVGDSVLVGAEGAGNGLVRKEYAGLVCSVVNTSHCDDCVEISHPDVLKGIRYTSRKKYLTKVDPKPKELTLEDTKIGDWVVCSNSTVYLTVGVAYRVTGYTAWGSLLISNPTKDRTQWGEGYAIQPKYFNKVLREVDNAASRVVKPSPESTSRSE